MVSTVRVSEMLKEEVTPSFTNLPTPTTSVKILNRLEMTDSVWGEAPCWYTSSLLLAFAAGLVISANLSRFDSRDERTVASPIGCLLAQSLLLPGLRLLAVCSRFRVQ